MSARPAGSETAPEADADPPASILPEHERTAATRLRTVLGPATAIMLALSWPLWISLPAFPKVPFVTGLPEPGPAASWALFALLVGSCLAAASGAAWRLALGLSAVLLSFLILQDQERFQPWAYQYLVVALLLASLPFTLISFHP